MKLFKPSKHVPLHTVSETENGFSLALDFTDPKDKSIIWVFSYPDNGASKTAECKTMQEVNFYLNFIRNNFPNAVITNISPPLSECGLSK